MVFLIKRGKWTKTGSNSPVPVYLVLHKHKVGEEKLFGATETFADDWHHGFDGGCWSY